MQGLVGETFFLDEFAFRQFDGGQAAQLDISKEAFVARVHQLYCKGGSLVDGYAPFCKHVFVPNFTSATLNALPISQENEALLRSGYSQRRPDELAVLTRWFPAHKVDTRKAKYLDLILYSREQLVKEHDAMPGKGPSESLPEAPWGIISVKPQDEDFETPMQPITIMRNSLGKEEGGSGVPLDREKYAESVAYWQKHAPIIAGSPSGE